MKITGGTAAGIILDTPRNMKVRPTGARAKQALFNSLHSAGLLADTVVVDLFSGTGGLGLEAASRGASEVYLVEKSSVHCRMALKNIEKLQRSGVSAGIRCIRTDACSSPLHLASIAGAVNLIFADPPYAESVFYFSRLLTNESFAEWGRGSLLVWEQPSDATLPSAGLELLWETERKRSFGGITFIFLKVR